MQPIYSHSPVDLLFGQGDKDVARPANLIHLGDRLGAVSQGSDGLSAPTLKTRLTFAMSAATKVGAGTMPSGAGGVVDNHLVDPCHLRRYDSHQHC
jgi:hypothetical protein